jgi:multidrug resistance efflux pump
VTTLHVRSWLVAALWWPWHLLRAIVVLPGKILRSPLVWAVLLLAFLAALVTYYGLANRFTPATTDAYVQAFVVQVAPQVAGEVVEVGVKENQRVARGDLLFALDPRPFEHRVRQLEANLSLMTQQVAQMDSELQAARAEEASLTADEGLALAVHGQEETIFKQGSTTERKFIDARQKYQSAKALVERARAQVRQKEQALKARVGDEHALIAEAKAKLAAAKLDLSWSRVYAPAAGSITDLQLRVGSFVPSGRPVLTCIETGRWWVVANFRENTLEYIRPGQVAGIVFKTYPGQVFGGVVESVGLGVSHGQGVPSGELPEINTPDSWISRPQRFQVRIAVQGAAAMPLRVGATASVTVYTTDDNPLNPIAGWWQDVESWLFYLR